MTELRKQINNIVEDYNACKMLAKGVGNPSAYEGTTATASDIRAGKTAYSNGSYITGTMASLNGVIDTAEDTETTFVVINNLRYLSVTDLDLSKYTSFKGSFQNLINLKELEGEFDTGETTTLETTFDGCASLKKITFKDTSKIQTWTKAFQNCAELEEIENLDMSGATAVTYAFSGCKKLKSIPELTKTFSSYNYMFKDCEEMEKIPFTTVPITSSLIHAFAGMKKITTAPAVYIPTTSGNVAYRSGAFMGCENLENITITAQSKRSNISMDSMFKNCKKITEIPACFENFTFQSSTTSMFEGCEKIKTVPSITIGGSSNYNIARMFAGCTSLETVGNISVYITHTGYTAFENLFQGCVNLKEVSFSASVLYGFPGWFRDCTSLDHVPDGLLAYTGALYCANAFRNSGLTAIPANFFDDRNPGGSSSRRGDYQYIFADCQKLTTIPMLNLKCSYPQALEGMFYNCPNLTDESLNNLMAILMNSGITSYKRLNYYGPSTEQCERCKSLSNYEAFVAAGWTA